MPNTHRERVLTRSEEATSLAFMFGVLEPDTRISQGRELGQAILRVLRCFNRGGEECIRSFYRLANNVAKLEFWLESLSVRKK